MAVFLGQCCKSESGVHPRGSDTLDRVRTYERRACQLSRPSNCRGIKERILYVPSVQWSGEKKKEKEKKKKKRGQSFSF